MVVSGAGDYTRLRVSCKGLSQGQTPARSYYCDFQGKPNLCRAYNQNPRHYFNQMMWELRKLSHACQGPKIYRPSMCKKYPDEAQMTFLSSWPKTTTPKPSKPVQEPRKPLVPAQAKPVATPKPSSPTPNPPAWLTSTAGRASKACAATSSAGSRTETILQTKVGNTSDRSDQNLSRRSLATPGSVREPPETCRGLVRSDSPTLQHLTG
ncbi:putative fibroblast growth factor-binding protein 2 [Scophthalmus maximus]|uniref:Putative fibroblast growth factor-binding protein 2 n=1 Tax=Scophthalmus maximus TaxID=52904 RepID=A0A2U9BNZ0_SCOMX|nr:putative fibroblast growth factor-binding protein 2 [Scophthalmus maximus]